MRMIAPLSLAFANIHCHTVYSQQDSTIDLDRLCERLELIGQKSVASTDHGNTCGVFQLKDALSKKGIKYFPGSEFYFTPDRNVKSKEVRKSEHVVAVAISEVGVRNLFKLSSISYLEGFYYKSRIDFWSLREHYEGLVVTSACLKGPVSKKILAGDLEGAAGVALAFKEVFGKNFYLEIMPHDLDEQRTLNKGLLELSERLEIPLLATTDAHYVDLSDRKYQDILFAVQLRKSVKDPERPRLTSPTHYLMSEEECLRAFAMNHSYIPREKVQQAMDNAAEILSGEPPSLTDGKLHFPTFVVTEEKISREGLDCDPNSVRYFEALAWSGLKKRVYYKDRTRTLAEIPEYAERLKYEIEQISKFGYVDYFLVVRDIVKHCEEVGIRVGPGRGTAGSSLVSYCLGITKVDPIKYKLIFERFINPVRASTGGLPDIDLDFDYQKRDQVEER